MSKSEFTSIRWPSGSLSAIRKVAKKFRMKPSTFIRYAVFATIERIKNEK